MKKSRKKGKKKREISSYSCTMYGTSLLYETQIKINKIKCHKNIAT